MKERKIVCRPHEVLGILEGRKTQTRRVVKPQPLYEWVARECENGSRNHLKCPYGQPGDRLWVRETWAYHVQAIGSVTDEDGPWVYAADGGSALQSRLCNRWRPSIHMPRWASRITLEVTGVRVERLLDISEADAKAEGIEQYGERWKNYFAPQSLEEAVGYSVLSFATLWESINGPGSWDANPFVWVVKFKRLKELE